MPSVTSSACAVDDSNALKQMRVADRNSQGHKYIEGKGEAFSIDAVAKTVEAELKRLGVAEGIETRVLLDDSLKTDIEGSAYWVESITAFINASRPLQTRVS